MTISLSKTRWIWFFSLALFILTANILVYRLDSIGPVPHTVALGSLLDLILIIPILAYVFIIRKRYSFKHLLLPVVLAGLVASYFIIPLDYLASYSFIKYVIFACEGAFLLFELYIGYKLLTKIPAVIKQLRTNPTEIPAFPHRLEQAAVLHFKKSRLLDVYCTEASIFYYTLFSWRKRAAYTSAASVFTYHKKTSAIAFYVMLIHALIIESVGFHFLLHGWNPIVALVALILNLYTILLFLAEIHALRLTPFMLTDNHLYLQVGVMKRLKVSLQDIKSIHAYEGPEKLSREEEKEVFDAVLVDFMKEPPAFEITFHTPQTAQQLYGFKKTVTKVHLRPDEPQQFYTALTEKLSKIYKNAH